MSQTFKSIAVGSTFEFDRTGLPYSHGMERGPWEKVSARCYVRESDGMRCEVGSTAIKVIPLVAGERAVEVCQDGRVVMKVETV